MSQTQGLDPFPEQTVSEWLEGGDRGHTEGWLGKRQCGSGREHPGEKIKKKKVLMWSGGKI